MVQSQQNGCKEGVYHVMFSASYNKKPLFRQNASFLPYLSYGSHPSLSLYLHGLCPSHTLYPSKSGRDSREKSYGIESRFYCGGAREHSRLNGKSKCEAAGKFLDFGVPTPPCQQRREESPRSLPRTEHIFKFRNISSG